MRPDFYGYPITPLQQFRWQLYPFMRNQLSIDAPLVPEAQWITIKVLSIDQDRQGAIQHKR
jgi:hypothetical protein